jgi:hypothetical protein
MAKNFQEFRNLNAENIPLIEYQEIFNQTKRENEILKDTIQRMEHAARSMTLRYYLHLLTAVMIGSTITSLFFIFNFIFTK